MLDLDEIQESLEALGAMTDAAEGHGTFCGMLLGQQDCSRWLAFTLENPPAAGDLIAREHLQRLQQLFEDVRAQLNSEDMEFELLLPDDEQEFAIRLLALAGWCQGFLYGLGVNGESALSALSEQGRECMSDLMEISQLAHDEEQSEETETVYAELTEHVRLSVIYMHEELNPVMPAPQVQ